MSEYQYYEFHAIDRPLTTTQIAELRKLSTRAEITSTSFTNTYHYGDFKGKPATLMERYFDAFVYVANWGTHWLMFRIPLRFIDVETASAYCDGEVLSLKDTTEHVVIDFSFEEEDGGGWEEDGEAWMGSLISIRAELMTGDYRALYLAWLASLGPSGCDDRDESEGDDVFEPPVPPGLATLTAAQSSLADFLRIEDELIEVAAAGSVGEVPAGPSDDDMARWIKTLPTSDKDSYLLRLVGGEADLSLRAELASRFREATGPTSARLPATGRRSISALLAARDALVEARRRKATEAAATAKARLDRERAKARAKHLDDLARRGSSAWIEAESLIDPKRPKDYETAVALLVDLRELAEKSGRADEADERIREFRRRHAKKPNLIALLNKNRLGK